LLTDRHLDGADRLVPIAFELLTTLHESGGGGGGSESGGGDGGSGGGGGGGIYSYLRSNSEFSDYENSDDDDDVDDDVAAAATDTDPAADAALRAFLEGAGYFAQRADGPDCSGRGTDGEVQEAEDQLVLAFDLLDSLLVDLLAVEPGDGKAQLAKVGPVCEQLRRIRRSPVVGVATLIAQFAADLGSLEMALLPPQGQLDSAEWMIEITDDLNTLFLIGTDVQGSCQDALGSASYNRCLLSYVSTLLCLSVFCQA
jgi:hypothetical protein